MEMRTCSKCARVLPLAEFRPKGKDYEKHCLDCRRSYRRAQYRKDPEPYRERSKSAAAARRARVTETLRVLYPSGKECARCHETKDIGDYYHYAGRPRSYCKRCHGDNTNESRRGIGVRTYSESSRQTTRERLRRQRLDPDQLFRVVYMDSRSSDRKKGRNNDLTMDFVRECVSQACFYCGDTQTRMTLDRIDNALGHTCANVNPACIRCNYMRGSMPYPAWLRLVPLVRKAREEGLFGAWTGRARLTGW